MSKGFNLYDRHLTLWERGGLDTPSSNIKKNDFCPAHAPVYITLRLPTKDSERDGSRALEIYQNLEDIIFFLSLFYLFSYHFPV